MSRGLFLLCVCCVAFATERVSAQSVDDIVNEIADEIDTEGTATDDDAANIAELWALSSSPLDINSADEQSLSRLFFLSPNQIRSILWHRSKVGPFQTPQELLTVRGLRYGDVYRILPFISISQDSVKAKRSNFVKGEVVARVQRTFPKSRGYYTTDTTDAVYGGGPYKRLLRARVDVGKLWSAGVVAETDAGEPKFVDFLGGFVSYNGGRGWLRKAIVGHYALRLGQGLGVWTGFGFNPTICSVSSDRNGAGLNPTLSAAESGYLRGAAVEMRFLPVRVTAFASRTREDATVYTDDDSSEYIMTISTGGLHRSSTERSHRHNDRVDVLGVYGSYDMANSRFGVGVNSWYSRLPIGRGSSLYRRNVPEGHRITTVHADYHVYFPRGVVYGEVAYQGSRALGFTQGVTADFGGGNYVCLALRHFGRHYYAVMQQPVSQSTHAGGESGGYLGVEFSPIGRLDVRASVDVWKLRWLQSSVMSPSVGWRLRVVANYAVGEKSTLSFRVRHTEKEETMLGREDSPDPDYDRIELKGLIVDGRNTSYKALLTSSVSPRVTLHSLVERVRVKDDGESSDGILLCQDAKISSPKEKVTLTASLSYFDTDTYAARVYTRQPNVLYDMSFGTCSGEGILVAGMLKVMPIDRLRIWIWASQTHYYDRDEVGSGYDLTKGSRRQTVKLQVQWKMMQRKRYDYFAQK